MYSQIQAWREEAERARQTQRDAEKRVAEAKVRTCCLWPAFHGFTLSAWKPAYCVGCNW